ncbi:hypothetical protein [Dictyobacter formicarum]|uniref:Linalool dehydratase/isomerase domain-containing protein n=1 Tax=Dictyobacter formicarum TaxID=2778368 RepID=A0ABQ3VSU6_9CHLR|nr:hypothetical protein [Dictyobacter formicarum]GHO88643.1 hypothetical protein KSZ_66490 [Dictyobacter formicarum]
MTKQFSSFSPMAREMVDLSLTWQDRYWNAETGLLKMESDKDEDSMSTPIPFVHHIRETIWYALGLLQRQADGDHARALQAIQTVLHYQFDEPGKPYDGTWYRFLEEPHPGEGIIWRDYDPNWREFIGSSLAIILWDYETELPPELVASIDEALRKAIRGALARGLSASYTNIALMHAFLLDFTGKRFGNPDWVGMGEAYAREIYHLFVPNHAFAEFNAPTYYGVDLYALGLWRSYSASALLQRLGAEMEATLWRDIALMYHAGMKNMTGPFDRAYGMDMQKYASLIGMWIWLAAGRAFAPFPDVTRPFAHHHDFAYVPCYVAVGVSVPGDVLPHLKTFQGERQVERVIADDPRRVVSAWIGQRLLLGSEETSYSFPASDQFHPVTIQWTSEQGQIDWIRLLYRTNILINARAEKNRIVCSIIGDSDENPDVIFQIFTPDVHRAAFQHDRWQLAGLTVDVETNASLHTSIQADGPHYDLHYTSADIPLGTPIRFVLTTKEDS